MESIIRDALHLLFSLGSKEPDVSVEDIFDRLNHRLMPAIFISLSGLSALHMAVGSPIDCWTPAHLKEDYEQEYVNNMCWVSSLYTVPMEEPIPMETENRYDNRVTSYRWAFLFFVAQAVMFKVPRHIWTYLMRSSGLDVDKIIAMTKDTPYMAVKEMNKQLDIVVSSIDTWLKSSQQKPERSESGITFKHLIFILKSRTFGKVSGRKMVSTYLLIKVMYLTNSAVQIFAVYTCFLNMDYKMFGVSSVRSLLTERQYQDLEHFPRIVFCDFELRQQTNVQIYTVQCVLSINIFLEKMFIVTWFCLVLINILNIYSTLKWLVRFVKDICSSGFFKKYILLIYSRENMDVIEEKELRHFVKKYLRPDGVFLIRMVALNTDYVITSNLIRHMMSRMDQVLRSKIKDEVKTINDIDNQHLIPKMKSVAKKAFQPLQCTNKGWGLL